MVANNLSWKCFVITVTVLLAFEVIGICGEVPEDLKKDILLYYDFDNRTQTQVLDNSGNGRSANMSNITIEDKLTDGKCNKSITLDSGPLNINIANVTTANFTNGTKMSGLTVAAWIFLFKVEKSKRKKRTIFTSLNADRKPFLYFGITRNNCLRWFATQKEKEKRRSCKPRNLDLELKEEVWYHVAVSYNPTRNPTCNFSINGKNFLRGKGNEESDLLVKNPPLGSFAFIGSKGLGDEPLNGSMDEFYIFNKTLSNEEIQILMNNTCKKHRSSTTPAYSTTLSPKIVGRVTGIGPGVTHQNFPTYSTTTTKMSEAEKEIQKAEKITNKTEAKTFLMEQVNRNLVLRNDSKDETNSVIRFTELLEKLGLILARNTLKINESQIVDTPSTLLLMNIPLSGFTFPSVEQQSAKEIDETISFPDDLVKTDDGVQRAFVCMAYSDLHENMAGEFTISSNSYKPNTTFELSSKIIGASIDPPSNYSLTNPITITFTHAKITPGKQICSFWNHSKSEWSTEGCEPDKERSTSTKTVCLCNHLTNFALLLQREGAPYKDPPMSLKILTIIGCTLSILACILCFVMFCTLKKKDIRHYLHINLAFAIAVAQLILLFGISQTKYEILCKALAACLHYFYMVAFLLMLCEGVHLAILIETAYSYGELKLPVYLITSWVLPLIIVGITFGVRFDNYGGSIACFLSADEGTVYAFVGPFALILVINFVILVIVLRQVVRKTSLPISSKTASKFEIARATIRSLIILFPVMGFTWLFGILFFGFRTLALEYLFAIFCSLQGFFIFLFQYALNTESRSAFMRATRRLRLTLTSSTHSTSVNGMKHTTPTIGKISSPEPAQAENSSSNDNCHLILYRTVDGQTGGTLDSRTTTTFI